VAQALKVQLKTISKTCGRAENGNFNVPQTISTQFLMVLPFCPSFPKPSLVRQEVPKLPHLAMILGDGMAQISHHFRSWNPHRRLRVEHFHVHTFQCLTWQATLLAEFWRNGYGRPTTYTSKLWFWSYFTMFPPKVLLSRSSWEKQLQILMNLDLLPQTDSEKGSKPASSIPFIQQKKHTPENPVLKL